jgi:hypothetical protein
MKKYIYYFVEFDLKRRAVWLKQLLRKPETENRKTTELKRSNH